MFLQGAVRPSLNKEICSGEQSPGISRVEGSVPELGVRDSGIFPVAEQLKTPAGSKSACPMSVPDLNPPAR